MKKWKMLEGDHPFKQRARFSLAKNCINLEVHV